MKMRGLADRVAISWVATCAEKMGNRYMQHPRIRLYTGTQAAGYYADHCRWWIAIASPNASENDDRRGAYEQPAVFRNNDLPGIMLASAAQRLIYRYAVKPMQRGGADSQQ